MPANSHIGDDREVVVDPGVSYDEGKSSLKGNCDPEI